MYRFSTSSRELKHVGAIFLIPSPLQIRTINGHKGLVTSIKYSALPERSLDVVGSREMIASFRPPSTKPSAYSLSPPSSLSPSGLEARHRRVRLRHQHRDDAALRLSLYRKRSRVLRRQRIQSPLRPGRAGRARAHSVRFLEFRIKSRKLEFSSQINAIVEYFPYLIVGTDTVPSNNRGES